jgi:hypothetical protein
MPTVLGQAFTRRELARRVGDFSKLFGVELLSHSDGRERALRRLIVLLNFTGRHNTNCHGYSNNQQS